MQDTTVYHSPLCVGGYNFKLNKDEDHSSNDYSYCMIMKTERNYSENIESTFSLSTHDFSDGD